MDISSASSQSLYAYQSALAGGTQTSAVFQALTQAYTSSSSQSTGDIADLAGEVNTSPLVSAIYASSSSASASSVTGLQPETLVGGIDSSTAANLLSGLSSDASSGLQGFDGALSNSGALAAAASTAQETYGTGTLTQDAQTQAAASATTAGTSLTSATAAYTSQAVANAQLAALNNTFSLLA
jgi:hypothetical protein